MKVAVICGGLSMERNISLISGERVFNALNDLGYQALKFDLSEQDIEDLVAWKPDIAYIALHGKVGEDGTIQEILELYGIPYTGPDSLACKLTFDKCLAKQMMRKNSVNTPEFYSFEESVLKEAGAARLLEQAASSIGYPVVVKPNGQGSSFGVSLVRKKDELPKAALSAFSYDRRILIERYIDGKEITVPVVAGSIFPAVEIQPSGDFFDFSAMYSAGETVYYVPARLEGSVLEQVEELALKTAAIFDAGILCRVDMIVENETMTPYVIEVNTSPGMTSTSLLPMSAEARGIDFPHLVEIIVIESLKQKSGNSGKIV